MNGAFYIGATGLRAQERALAVTANNIANLNTPSFKRTQVRFGELTSAASEPDGLARPSLSSGAGVAAMATMAVFDQGELRATGSATDLAIQGPGFIEVMGAAGQRLLWRGGTLTISPDGLLSTTEGLPLQALITIPEGVTDLRVALDGTVAAALGEDGGLTELGRIDLISIRDPGSLEALGGGLYRPSADDSGAVMVPGEEGAGTIVQGALEASNVALANEMVTLMLLQRAYSASAQALQAGDQLMGIANGLRR
ncbi:flagellar hook-basal body protein [Brevundimonas sp.]|uniref:flagellar hook-basal body protein n=1 Tax=Brevundimonas sp. TaxID=1871086 RepID=UPI002D460CC2|nr:flagellar hook-basal body protein [Brevundimonas sp.]HYC68879.1 flagellar hook-basal body protein [Brevundimonas sp.]